MSRLLVVLTLLVASCSGVPAPDTLRLDPTPKVIDHVVVAPQPRVREEVAVDVDREPPAPAPKGDDPDPATDDVVDGKRPAWNVALVDAHALKRRVQGGESVKLSDVVVKWGAADERGSNGRDFVHSWYWAELSVHVAVDADGRVTRVNPR